MARVVPSETLAGVLSRQNCKSREVGLKYGGWGAKGLQSGGVNFCKENSNILERGGMTGRRRTPASEVTGLWLQSASLMDQFLIADLSGQQELLRGLAVIIWCLIMLQLQFI